MNRVVSQIMVNHSPHYLSKVQILRAIVSITEIYLNRNIGTMKIMTIQLQYNSESTGGYLHFYPT